MTERTILAPEDIEADFVFRCYDNSMVFAHLFTGDMVFIRSCDDVEDGHIAAISIERIPQKRTAEINLLKVWQCAATTTITEESEGTAK